jgi:hypothetical protein
MLTQGLNTQGGAVSFEINAPTISSETALPRAYAGGGGGGGTRRQSAPHFTYRRAAEQRVQPMPQIIVPQQPALVQPAQATQPTWQIWLAVGGALALGLGVGVLVGFYLKG